MNGLLLRDANMKRTLKILRETIFNPNFQRWGVVKYKCYVTVQIFQVTLLYFSISFYDDILLILPAFVHKYIYFLLLTLRKHAHYFCV